MNNRLQQFLELENLTPARLADMLGIQRSGLSHILSGRNKPSYDFLNRILSKFPHINADWLLTGRGKAYRDHSESVIIPGTLPPHKKGVNLPYGNPQNFNGNGSGFATNGQADNRGGENFFSDVTQITSASSNDAIFGTLQEEDSPILDRFDNIFLEEEMDKDTANINYNTEKESITPVFNSSQPSENSVKQQTKGIDGKKKRIKRVIVFYNDGSFEELFPHIR